MNDKELFQKFIHENELTLKVLEQDQNNITEPIKKAIHESYVLALKTTLVRAKQMIAKTKKINKINANDVYFEDDLTNGINDTIIEKNIMYKHDQIGHMSYIYSGIDKHNYYFNFYTDFWVKYISKNKSLSDSCSKANSENEAKVAVKHYLKSMIDSNKEDK